MSSDTVHYHGFPSDAIITPLRTIQIRNGRADRNEIAYRSHQFRNAIRTAILGVFHNMVREANCSQPLSRETRFVPGVASALLRSIEKIVGPISEGREDILSGIFREVRRVAHDRTINNGKFALQLTEHCEYAIGPKWSESNSHENRLLPLNINATA